MDLRLRPFTSASLAATVLLVSLNASAWAVGGNIRSIQFDPTTHRLRINVSSSVHATINTVDMYGRKRVVVDVENAAIGSTLPHDPELLQQLSRSWPSLRNITTYQYGGANWPIVRVLLDLDAQTQDIELTQSQGNILELQVGGNAAGTTSVYSNAGPPIPQSAALPSGESSIKSIIKKPFTRPTPPPHPVVALPSDDTLNVDSLKEALVRINERYDQLAQENAQLEQQVHAVSVDANQAKERLARQVNTLQAENNSLKVHAKSPVGSTTKPTTSTATNTAEMTALRDKLSRQITALQAENNALKAHPAPPVTVKETATDNSAALNTLRKQITSLQAENNALKTAASAKKSPDRTAELNALRSQLSSKINRLQSENAALQNQVKDAQAEAQAAKASAPIDRTAEINSLREQATSQIANLQTENTSLANQLKSARDEAQAAKSTSSNQGNAKASTVREELSKEIASLQASNRTLENELKAAQAEARAAKANAPADRSAEINTLRSQLSRQIAELQDDNTTLQSQVKAAQAEARNAKANAPADRTSELNALRNQLSKQIADLQADNKKLESQVKEAKTQAHSGKTAALPDRSNAELTTLREQHEQLSGQISRLQSENSALQDQLKEAKEASLAAPPSEPGASVKDGTAGLSSELSTMRKQLTVAQISLNESIRTINAQNKEMAELRSQVQQDGHGDGPTKQEVEHLHAEIGAKDNQIRELKSQLTGKSPKTTAGAKTSATALQQETNTLKQQLNTARQQNAELQEKLANAEKASVAPSSSASSESTPEAEQAYQAGKKAKAERQTEQALQAYRQAQALAPNNSRYTIDYSAALAEAHRYPEGITLLTSYIGKNPADREAYTQLGKLYLLNDQAEAASQAFTRAISVSTLNNYATALKKTNRMDEAESVFKLALTINSKDSEVLFNLGNLYNATNKLPQAKEYYTKALALRPNFAEAHYNLGLIHAKLGERAQAITHLEKFLQLSPSAKNTDTIRAYIEKLKT